MLSVVIPIIDEHTLTLECIDYLTKNAMFDNQYIVVDNGSDVPFVDERVNTLYTDEVIGVPAAIHVGLSVAKHDIVVFLHNDVLIHQLGWDILIKTAFDVTPNLALAGLFGATGLHPDRSRIHPHSNMQGKKYGTRWNHHGHNLTWIVPAAYVDGLCMAFKRDVLLSEDLTSLPPHHWYDILLTLQLIEKGYSVATVGAAFDHMSGATSCRSDKYHKFAEQFCLSNGITHDNYDTALYRYGEQLFINMWAPKLPLTVDGQFNYTWTK